MTTPNDTTTMKRCKMCGVEFPANREYFYEQKFPDGHVILKSVCKPCFMQREKERIAVKRASRSQAVYPPWREINKDFPDICEQPHMTKRCSKCGVEYPHTSEHFHRSSKQPWGLSPKCKVCIATYNREYNNRPAIKERSKEYRSRPEVQKRQFESFRKSYKKRRADPIRRQEMNARGAAEYHKRRARGSFTPEDIEAIRVAQGNRCYLCGKKLKKYHIDHFIPISKGGTNDPGNLRLACPHCNLSKNAKHPFELGRLI